MVQIKRNKAMMYRQPIMSAMKMLLSRQRRRTGLWLILILALLVQKTLALSTPNSNSNCNKIIKPVCMHQLQRTSSNGPSSTTKCQSLMNCKSTNDITSDNNSSGNEKLLRSDFFSNIAVMFVVTVAITTAACSSNAFTYDTTIESIASLSTTTFPVEAIINNNAIIDCQSVAGAAVTSSNIISDSSIDWQAIVKKAGNKALGGGGAGAAAAVVQVCTLMWLRTSMNYQYRYGGTLQSSLSTLWSQGGIQRLYQGLPFAILQGPLTRFGDTAANVGILTLLQTLPATQDLPLPIMTAAGSITAGLWRILLMPIDASKTVLQVEGQQGLERLWQSVLTGKNPSPLYRGAVAQAAATTAGHFPWFITYNFLNEQLPTVSQETDLLVSLARSALLGFCASCVSDCISNSLRVIKTTRQTIQASDNGQDLSYPQIVKLIIEQDGVVGLFGRGLQTRLLTNAIQGAAFSVLWRYFQQMNGV